MLITKLFSLEWLVRYVSFLKPNTVRTALHYFDDISNEKNHMEKLKYLQHHSEIAPSAVIAFINFKEQLGNQEITQMQYNQNNMMILQILEVAMFNDLNRTMLLQIHGLEQITRIFLEQRLPNKD